MLPKRKFLQGGIAEIFVVLGVVSTSVAAGAALYNTIRWAKVNLIDNPATRDLSSPTLQLKTLIMLTTTPVPNQVQGVVKCGYPYTSANPRTNIKSDENQVLRGFAPDIAGPGDILKMWSNDEHAMILGVKNIEVKTSAGSQTYNFPVSPLPSVPGSAVSPQVGATELTGDLAGTDIVGRPIFPSLFITDITDNPNDTSGDWQAGGTAIAPHAVFGAWKSADKTVDKTSGSTKISFKVGPNPPHNDWNLGPGTLAVSPGMKNEGHGMETQWHVDRLVAEGHMQPGRTYRVQFIVHDGDQTKTGGDEGEACATVRL